MPDEFVRRAEQIELVDITPEALRRRMAHGNVYGADKVDAALANYFQVGNLTALRELALLWVADEVDVALQRYRTDKHDHRGLGDPGTGGRRAHRRPGERDRAAPGGPHRQAGRRGRPARRARAARRRAGRRPGRRHSRRCAGWPTTSARRSTPWSATGTCPTALLEFARGVNATQLVLGTSRRSRLARVFDRGIGARVVQESGSIDVHMVTHDEAGRAAAAARLPGGVPGAQRVLGWVLAVLAAGRDHRRSASCCRRLIGLSTDVVLFFLVTVVVALVGGLGPGAAGGRGSAGCC